MSRSEKTALGFYLSAHPLDEYKGILDGLKITTLADHESVAPGDILTLAGIVSGAQIKYSKKGNRFCIFRLEDQSAGVKCLVWAEGFGKFGELIKDESLLIVEGRVETAEGAEITLIVSEVRSLAGAESGNARRLSIGLPSNDIDENYLFDIFSILGQARGTCEVSIEVPVGGLNVEIETQALRVRGSGNLEAALRSKGCSVAWHL